MTVAILIMLLFHNTLQVPTRLMDLSQGLHLVNDEYTITYTLIMHIARKLIETIVLHGAGDKHHYQVHGRCS